MDERALTAADGTPLGFAGGGESGALISFVCPECGYAELHADEVATTAPGGSADDRDDLIAAAIAAAQSGDIVAAIAAAECAAASDASAGGATRAEASGRMGQLQDVLKSRGILGTAEPQEPGVGSLIIAAICAAFMTAGIVWLWYSSGPVMEAGGFVATGGPYVIAHQAEDWIWLPTLGATVMVWAAVTNFFVAQRLNRPNLMLAFWAALFGLLSVPFFKYGFNAPGGGKSWTWIFLGVMFALFALPAVLILLLPESWRGFRGVWGWANLLGVVGGVVGGIWVWNVVA